MRPPVPSAPLALWVLGCFSLLLWLWALCTACHRKRAQRQQTGQQGSLIPVEMSLLRQTHLCSLSKSDTRLHELRRGPCSSIAPRPASMDLLHPHWLEMSRGSTRSQVLPSAFPPRQLPRAPPAAPATAPSPIPEATYSNVGLAAIPRASLAASPVVWAGTQLTISCARLGPGAEYACVQKHKGTEQGYQELQQKAKVIPATQMDVLYSKVCKPKRKDPRPVTDQLDPYGGRAVLALESGVEYEAIALRGQDMNQGPLENVYESIREGPSIGRRLGVLRAAPQAVDPGALATKSGASAQFPAPGNISVPVKRFSALQPGLGVEPGPLPDAQTGLHMYAGPGEGSRALVEPQPHLQNSPRKSPAGRGHSCCSPYKPVYQPTLFGDPSCHLQSSRSQVEPEQSDGKNSYYMELGVGRNMLMDCPA